MFQTMEIKKKSITLLIAKKLEPPSFDPLNSDSLVNAIHFEPLIGTLVRLAPSGRYEPYLASSWETSDDKKIWTFKIKKGLFCEDGTPINAENYRHGVHQVLRTFNKHTQLPILRELDGFLAFLNNKAPDIEGIKALTDQTIQFIFSKPVTSGFIEYLGLPFLGFYCKNNFDEKGFWKSHNSIISSSSYRLEKWDGIGPVVLAKRNDWPSDSQASPELVTIKLGEPTASDLKRNSTIVLSFGDPDELPKNELVQIPLVPTVLRAITLSTHSSSFFGSQKNRDSFKKALLSTRINTPWDSKSAQEINTFYSGKMALPPSEKIAPLISIPKIPIRILVPANPGKISKYLTTLATSSLELMGLRWRILERKNTQKDLMTELRNDEAWDMRIVGVDTGGGIENQLVKFMFCSKLGVSFPDPNENICNLVSKYENNFGDNISSEEMALYLSEFNSIIERDSAVFPILKSGLTWLVSTDLKTEFLSPTTAVPELDRIQWK